MSKVSTKKAIALVTGAILATGVGVYLFKSQGKSAKGPSVDGQHIDRETIIKVLKELKKELFTVFQNFAAVAANIKQQSMGRARPEDIKMMLLEQPMFRGEIEQVEDMVYASHNITRQQIQHYCQNVYREDQTIQELQKSMKDSFDRSFTGIGPDPKSEIPQFLTAEKTFEILERVMTESALKLNEKLLELQERGEQINFQSPRMMEIMQSLKMDSSKKEILAEYGLDKFEDPGSKILQYATQIYSQSNQGNFNAKMKQLDMKYQAIMEQLIMSGPMSHEELKHRMEPNPPQQQNIPFQEVQEQEEPQQQEQPQQEQPQPQQEAPVEQVEQQVVEEVQPQPVAHEEVAEQSQ